MVCPASHVDTEQAAPMGCPASNVNIELDVPIGSPFDTTCDAGFSVSSSDVRYVSIY